MAFDTIVLQHAVDPKSVKTRFLYYDDRNDLTGANLHLFREQRKPCPQASDIAAANRMLRHLFSAARRQRCNEPSRSTEFQRDEDRAKVGADSGRCLRSLNNNLHGASREWSVSNLAPLELRSLSTPHGISFHRRKAPERAPVGQDRGQRCHAPSQRTEDRSRA